MHVTATLFASILAPVLNADRLVGLHHIGNLELWVHLHTALYIKMRLQHNKAGSRIFFLLYICLTAVRTKTEIMH